MTVKWTMNQQLLYLLLMTAQRCSHVMSCLPTEQAYCLVTNSTRQTIVAVTHSDCRQLFHGTFILIVISVVDQFEANIDSILEYNIPQTT
jgi:hypothetical protein